MRSKRSSGIPTPPRRRRGHPESQPPAHGRRLIVESPLGLAAVAGRQSAGSMTPTSMAATCAVWSTNVLSRLRSCSLAFPTEWPVRRILDDQALAEPLRPLVSRRGDVLPRRGSLRGAVAHLEPV
eukprot:CAMPEP_0175863334 /NCGR_PEP_ID=MMETSP0107_2-20121207/32436_1 /TAXON_ID=195067 ORGANISM="Goniomonas pacifica, Strain CCMP1869" /NCGR_SAMPLE_ID=MMETSP0107_2 /ASSEMBLY_ACC=CAM_ASM_000203 /LENGTH=124 /DNA_ID=CAMNT_0017180419 /DNA_START=45 /DNA_END=419 /DNA_ORIENTATION=+